MIQNVPTDQTFWLLGGKQIKNVAELGRELKAMSADTFAHHVNSEKNDFANWIQYCVKDEKLATLVKTTKNKERMAAIVERRIQEFTAIPKKEAKPVNSSKTAPKLTITEPTIIRTKNVTPLTLSLPIEKTGKTTPLKPAPERIKPTIIRSKHKTPLTLTHKKTEEKPQHYSAVLLASHLALGVVVGVAVAILILAFG